MERYQQFNLQVSVSNYRKFLNAQSKVWSSSVFPGISLCFGLAWLASLLKTVPLLSILSSMILAIALGMLVRNTVGVAPIYEPGIRFTLRRILRVTIAFLGLQLNLAQIMEVGPSGLAIVVITLFSTFWFTCWLGQQLGIRRELAQLIAAGTSICGASAVIASNTVIKGSDEDAAYAVATVTLFGTIAMFLYPLLASFLDLTPQAFGIWCGASIHEVAQAVATAFQAGTVSGQLGTVIKLSRVLLLAPMILMLGVVLPKASQSSDRQFQAPPFPWFVLGFIGCIGLNSLGVIPSDEKSLLVMMNQFLLTIAVAAMGLETKLHKIVQVGMKPLYLAAAAWLFIALSSVSLITILYR